MDRIFFRFPPLLLAALGLCGPWLATANEPPTAVATSDIDAASSHMTGNWGAHSRIGRDIGVDAQGVPWIVSFDEKVVGGYAIYKRTGTTWSKVEGGAVKIAVAPNGGLWIVDDAGNVRFRKAQDTAWTDVAGKAREISLAPDGVAWKIGSEPIGADYGIYTFNGSGWDKVDGSAIHISIGTAGADWDGTRYYSSVATPWIVKSNGDIYWRHRGQWELQGGLKASDIAVDAKGPAWILGSTAGADGNLGIYQDDGYHAPKRAFTGTPSPEAPRELSCSEMARHGS